MKKDCPVAKIVKIVLVVVATLAALAAGYVLVKKLVCKKKKGCCDVSLEDEGCADCCFDNSDCADCPIVEEAEYAEIDMEDIE